MNSLPPDLHKFAVGTSPFSFILVRDRVLEAVCQRVPWDHLGNCNCELRFATLAHACGFVPVANPLASWNITWQELPDTVPVNAGMWHPVKWLVSRQRPSVSPPGAVAWLQQGLRVPICLGNPDEQATLGTLEQFDPNVELCALLTRTGIINWLIDRNGYSSYLEIGIGDGRNFSEVNCERKVSVDPAEGEYAEASPTHRMTSDEFFASNRETFDIVFVDGLHHRDVVFRDLCNALRILNPGGAIVCHDLNPSTEAMQRVPRETNAWTGDCWKAWVQLRRERPELPMMVAKTDYGVGIIVPEAKFTAPKIDDELTWKNFDRERSTWLNLVPPGALGEVLFGDLKTEQCLAVVTLWRGEWNSVQADLLRWLVQEKFPAGTQFVWVAPEGSTTEAALEEAWAGFNACGRDYCIDLIQTPVVEIQGVVEKHHLVAALYNEALKGVRSEWVMFVEDDVVPMIGGVERLLTAMRTQPPDTAGIAAAYRLRENPKMACATDANWVYLPWPEESVTAQIEVLQWIFFGKKP